MVEITHTIGPVAARLGGAGAVVRDEATIAVHRTGQQGVARAKSLARVQSGTMRRSITMTAGVMTASYGPHATRNGFPYPVAVERGRRGFSARRAKVLRFVVGGRTLFRRRVGPARARPFMRPSADLVRQVLPREMRAAVARIRQRLGVS